ncbi:MAG: hypothetical protein ABI419_10070, partial [Ginsengibacter sp.]
MKTVNPLPQGCPVLQQPAFLSNMFSRRNFYFQKLLVFFLGCMFLTGFSNKLYADITLATAPLAAAGINQG